MARVNWIIGTLAALALTACGGSNTKNDMGGGGGDMRGGGGGDMGGGNMSIEQACAAYAAAQCGRLSACNAFSLQTEYKDMADCVSRQQALCKPRVTWNGTAETPDTIAACAQALTGLSCADFRGGGTFLPAACMKAGMLANGTACGDGHQCKSGYCNLANQSSCGKCADRTAAGANCTSSDECQGGMVCAGTISITTKRKCVKPVGMGEACSADLPCQATLYCGGDKKCAPELKESNACAGTSFCGPGLYCNISVKPNKCAPYKLAQAGDSCNVAAGAPPVKCTGGSSCFGAAGAKKCVAPAADNAACDRTPTDKGPGCQSGATCVNKVCTVADPGSCR